MYTARKNVEGNEPERTGLPGNVVRSIKLKYKYFYFFFYKYKYINIFRFPIMYDVIHSMVILFTSLALGSCIQEIYRPSFDINVTLSITFIPAFAFSVYNLGMEVTIAALLTHILILYLFER